MQLCVASVCVALALAAALESVSAVITVQIGGATRLNSLSRQRERYSCYWDCDLVGCQIARDDDECAYDCEKICRVKYDYAAARSGAAAGSPAPVEPKSDTLSGKSAASEPASAENDIAAPSPSSSELVGGKLPPIHQSGPPSPKVNRASTDRPPNLLPDFLT